MITLSTSSSKDIPLNSASSFRNGVDDELSFLYSLASFFEILSAREFNQRYHFYR